MQAPMRPAGASVARWWHDGGHDDRGQRGAALGRTLADHLSEVDVGSSVLLRGSRQQAHRRFASHALGAHVLELVLKLDFLGDGDAILCDAGRTIGLVQHQQVVPPKMRVFHCYNGHHKFATRNFGVTTSLWDHVFGTVLR
jgi:hypothetical protein